MLHVRVLLHVAVRKLGMRLYSLQCRAIAMTLPATEDVSVQPHPGWVAAPGQRWVHSAEGLINTPHRRVNSGPNIGGIAGTVAELKKNF